MRKIIIRAIPLLALLLVLLPGGGLSAAESRFSLEQIKADLVLQTKLKTPSPIHAGGPVGVDIELRNQSQDTAYPILLPGIGSQPYVYFTATIDTDRGESKAAPRIEVGGCGTHGPYLERDLHTLQPGGSVALKGGLSPSSRLEFQEEGRVRLLVHYMYQPLGQETLAKLAIDKEKQHESVRDFYDGLFLIAGHMKGIPAFDLVSQPVEFDVIRPLDLQLSVKSSLRADRNTKLSELFDVKLANHSKQAFQISSPQFSSGVRLYFEIKGRGSSWWPPLNRERNTEGGKMVLLPGKDVALLGNGAFADGLDGTWRYPNPEVIQVRARLQAWTYDPPANIASNWVDLKVRTVSEAERKLEYFIAELSSPSDPILYSQWAAIVLLAGFLAWQRWRMRRLRTSVESAGK